MAHTLLFDVKTTILEVHAQGKITLTELKEIFAEGAKIAAERGTNLILADFRQAIPSLTTIEIYDLPEILSSILQKEGLSARRMKRAIITSPTHLEDFNFSSNVASNRGQWAKIFTDPDEAKEWLLSQTNAA